MSSFFSSGDTPPGSLPIRARHRKLKAGAPTTVTNSKCRHWACETHEFAKLGPQGSQCVAGAETQNRLSLCLPSQSLQVDVELPTVKVEKELACKMAHLAQPLTETGKRALTGTFDSWRLGLCGIILVGVCQLFIDT